MAGFDLTYRSPASVAGGAVAPTAAQAMLTNAVVVDVHTDAGAKEDNTNITHNLNLSADGLDGRPELGIVCLANGTVLTGLTAAVADANTITITKIIKGANTAADFRISIRRPHSITR